MMLVLMLFIGTMQRVSVGLGTENAESRERIKGYIESFLSSAGKRPVLSIRPQESANSVTLMRLSNAVSVEVAICDEERGDQALEAAKALLDKLSYTATGEYRSQVGIIYVSLEAPGEADKLTTFANSLLCGALGLDPDGKVVFDLDLDHECYG